MLLCHLTAFTRLKGVLNLQQHTGFIRAISSFRRHFSPSPEQTAIVQALKKHNVCVSARPGAGKTATAEAVVASNPHTPTAIITYSKRLQLDTQERLKNYPSADVFTFHALAGRLFGVLVKDDQDLRELRDRRAQPVWTPSYEILILDELQDLTELLYWLTCTFISSLTRSLPSPPRLLALGDPRQAIYEFRGADARYLELAKHTFLDISPYSWLSLKLAKSFRLSHQTAKFVNTFIGDSYITGSHDGPLPLYINANEMNVEALLSRILPIIHKYSPENCAIIAPSVRSGNPVLPMLINRLSRKYHIPIAVSTSDEAPLDPDVLRGKVTVSTYHQFKGSERDVVIVYGADASYFEFMARNLPDDRCPNATFVALTRARKQLVIIQSHKHPAMPFVPWSKMKDTCKFVNLVDEEPHPPHAPGRPLQLGLLLPKSIRVTELSRHVPEETLEQLAKKHVHIKELASPLPLTMRINAPGKVLTDTHKDHYESVSDLSGLAVTAAFEWKVSGKCTTFGYGTKKKPSIPSEHISRSRWFAREATKYEARVSHYESRLVQMKGHTFAWLDEHLNATTARLSEQFPDPSRLKFETFLSNRFKVDDNGNTVEPYQTTRIVGRADIIERSSNVADPPTIWEIKFVSSLSMEHVIQVIIYGYLWAAQRDGEIRRKPQFPRLVIFNIRDGTKWEIQTTFADATALIEGLLRARYTATGALNTSSFLDRCEKVRQEVAAAKGTWDDSSIKQKRQLPAVPPKKKKKKKKKKKAVTVQ